MSVNRKMDKQCIRTMEYCSALKSNEILIHAATWMNCGNIMLSEIGWAPKDDSCGSHLHEVNSLEVTSGWGGRETGRFCLMSMGLLFGKMSQFWRQMLVMVAQHCDCFMSLNYGLKND